MDKQILISFIFFSISSIILAVHGQTLTCTYTTHSTMGYRCALAANNPNGFDNFTRVAGTHLAGRIDYDVVTIFRGSGSTTIIPSIICQQFRFLNRIEMNSYAIRFLSSNSIDGCVHLEILVLSSNQITELSSDTFQNLLKITQISLNSNLITSLGPRVFADLEMLMTINLSANRIVNINSQAFINLPNLRTLDLSNNQLATIGNGAFVNLPRLTTLMLNNNMLMTVGNWFDRLNGLTDLRLQFNRIERIENDIFPSLANLDILNLNNNRLPNIGNWFKGLGNLRELTVQFNMVNEILSAALEPLVNLRTLRVNNNNMININSNSFPSQLPNLVEIFANVNRIREIDPEFYATMPILNRIDLRSNICINRDFTNFRNDINGNLVFLETCFSNFYNNSLNNL